MKMEKKSGKLLLGCLISFLLILTANIRVQAAQEEKLFLIGAMDDANELVGIGIAVTIYEDEEYYVLADKSVMNDSAAAYVLINLSVREESYDLGEVAAEIEDFGIVLFSFKGDPPPRSLCVKGEQPVYGADLNAVYVTSDLEAASFQIRLTGAEAGGDYAFLDGFPVDSSGNETGIPSDLEKCFPLPMINDDGNLVALMLESGKIISFLGFNVDEFQAGAEQDKKDPEQTNDDIEINNGKENNTNGRVDNDDDIKTSDQLLRMAVLVGIGILAVAAVFGVYGKLSKKKKGEMVQGAVSAQPQPWTDMQPVQPHMNAYSPTEPYTGPSPVQSASPQVRWNIAGVAGAMQGRNYSVGKDGISIGRGSSSNIRFSDDVKGVSRLHCRIFTDGQKLLLMDCNSTYGTYLKGYGKLPAQKPVAIKQGDLFYLGSEREGFIVQ